MNSYGDGFNTFWRMKCLDLFPDDRCHQLTYAAVVTVFAEVNTLPGAEIETALGDGNGQADTAESGLGMGWHIIAALHCMFVSRQIFGYQTIEDCFHIGAHIRVAVLIDGQSATGMLAKEVQNASLGKRRQLAHNVSSDKMEAPRKGTKSDFNLLNHGFK